MADQRDPIMESSVRHLTRGNIYLVKLNILF